MQHNGQEQSVGQILFGALGSEFHRRSQGGQWGSMSLTPDDLAAVGEVVVGREVTVPSVARIIQPPPQLMSHLLRLHAAAGHLAETVPDILAHPEIARAMEHALVQAMVECVSTGLIDEPKVRSHTRVPVMRRFEQILAAHEGETLYLAEVCAKIGVSDRTLRGHCQEHLGMSPHKYLWLRRMNLARRALALADPAGASVTAIATDHGFWELGQFAVSYRRLFGESPSVTLRRVPEPQLPAHGRSPFDLNLSSG